MEFFKIFWEGRFLKLVVVNSLFKKETTQKQKSPHWRTGHNLLSLLHVGGRRPPTPTPPPLPPVGGGGGVALDVGGATPPFSFSPSNTCIWSELVHIFSFGKRDL